eukprot:scaffold952_cov409-Prasinococcus_capsulatus_cf.AAC.20
MRIAEEASSRPTHVQRRRRARSQRYRRPGVRSWPRRGATCILCQSSWPAVAMAAFVWIEFWGPATLLLLVDRRARDETGHPTFPVALDGFTSYIVVPVSIMFLTPHNRRFTCHQGRPGLQQTRA